MVTSAGLQSPSPIGDAQIAALNGFTSPSERRRNPRRKSDQHQSILASLAIWFANSRDQPLLIIDCNSVPVLMNDVARHVLPLMDDIHLRNGKLTFAQSRHAAQIRQVFDTEKIQVVCKCRLARKPIDVVVSPLNPDGSTRLALLVLSLPDGQPLQTNLACAEYGLTRAESEISLSVFNGLSLVQIASARGVSVNTIKTQVRNIFRKCEVNSKVALTRTLGELFARAEKS